MREITKEELKIKGYSNKLKNLIGNKYGFLKVIDLAPKSEKAGSNWVCICICNKIVITHSKNLQSGYKKSCGCKQKYMISSFHTKHGGYKHELYYVWSGMMKRCYNKKHEYYDRYGGRGISVCEEWKDFNNFVKDMSPRPDNTYTLDRKDNNGNYLKENCRWATKEEQECNKINTKHIEYNGKSQTLLQWSKELNILKTTLKARLYSGWIIEEAFSTPVINRGKTNG